MKTCGYDVLLEIDERLLNKALAAVFYTGMLKTSGSYTFVEGIPKELQGFTKLSYRVRLKNEPYVDLTDSDQVYLKLSVELFLIVLSNVEVEFDVDFRALAAIHFDMDRKVISYDLSQAEISDITMNDMIKVNKNALDKLNEIARVILSKFLTEDLKEIKIPVAMCNMELPEMPDGDENKLPVNVADVRILNSKVLAVGIHFFDHTGGDISSARDFTDGSEFFLAMKEDTLKKIYDFWWAKKTLKLKQDFSGEKVLSFKEKIGKGMDILTRLATLGFIERTSEVKEAILKYQGSVEVLEKPEFDFADGGKAIITKLKVKASFSSHIDALVSRKVSLDTSSFIPDKITPWNDDITIGQYEKREKIMPVNEEALIELTEASGIITLNEKNNIVVHLDEADLNLKVGSKWYQALTERLINQLLDLFEDNIISRIPDFVISPSLMTSSVEMMGYTFGAVLHNIAFDNGELLLNANLCVNELARSNVPVPLYIAGTKTKRLHRFDCRAVEDIGFEHRRGYHVYDEAIRDGYKPCRACLRK